MHRSEFDLKYPRWRDGTSPIEEWLRGFDDLTRAMLVRRIGRLRLGLWANWKRVGHGVIELIIDTGPGYRVYFALSNKTTIILLYGGTKKNQQKDIKKAQRLWQELKG
jgi:putative addiction module killer protein